MFLQVWRARGEGITFILETRFLAHNTAVFLGQPTECRSCGHMFLEVYLGEQNAVTTFSGMMGWFGVCLVCSWGFCLFCLQIRFLYWTSRHLEEGGMFKLLYSGLKLMLSLVAETPKLWINTRLKSRKPIVISRQDVFCLFESHQSHSVPGRYLGGTDLVSF